MKILWFTWKDMTHPFAGGAELVNERLAEQLVKDGHEVTLLVGGYPGCQPKETINGYKVVRLGGPYSVYWKAYRYYKKHLKGWADIVIEEVNTVPFFTRFYVKQPSALVIHQLCREIWFYQKKQPLSLLGYLAEPLYLRLLQGVKIMTISESSRQDLIKYGFRGKDIQIISMGSDIKRIDAISDDIKYKHPTLLSLGAFRPMKRTLDQVKAFELAKLSIPDLRLKIAGDNAGSYGKQVLDYIAASPYAADIQVLGHVSSAQRHDLMRRSHMVMSTSVKEGWGLTVTEAASQGTIAAVYNIDGLRDSTHYGQTGVISSVNSPVDLARIISQTLKNKKRYTELSRAALEVSRRYTFDQTYRDFKINIAQLSTTVINTQIASEEELA